MKCQNTMTGETKEHVMTREMLNANLSEIQTLCDKAVIDAKLGFSRENPPPVLFRSKTGFFIALNHNRFLNPDTRPSENSFMVIIPDQRDWEAESARFEKSGYKVDRMLDMEGKPTHHTMWVRLDDEGRVTHFSLINDIGTDCQPVDCYYYVVNHPTLIGNDVVGLLPRFMTDTTLIDEHICFVYMHVVPRNPAALSRGEAAALVHEYLFHDNPYLSRHNDQKMVVAAMALVNRPPVLRDFRVYPTHEGREMLLAGPPHNRPSVSGWELWTAAVVNRTAEIMKGFVQQYMHRLTKPQRWAFRTTKMPVINFLLSKEGCNQVQDALQYGFADHPAYIADGDVEQFSKDARGNFNTSDPEMVRFLWCLAYLIYNANANHAREVDEQRNDQEHRRRQQMHDAIQEAEQAEERAKALRRRLQAIEARRARAAQEEPTYTARREPPRSGKAAKKANRQQRRQAQLVHEVHVLPEQREYREDAFNMRQVLISLEATTRKARARAADMKQLLANTSAAKEAATHVVPALPTIFDAMGRPGANLGAAV